MSLNDGRAKPKSQILSLQSELARIFLGFRSRWNTLAAGHRHAQLVIRSCECGQMTEAARAGTVDSQRQLHTCVDILQAPQKLVQEKLVVLWREIVVGFDDLQFTGVSLCLTMPEIGINGVNIACYSSQGGLCMDGRCTRLVVGGSLDADLSPSAQRRRKCP